MINDISNIQNIYDVSYTPRPMLILYDISNLDVKYKTANPGLVKLSQADKDYLAEWRLKQRLLFLYINEYDARDKDIEDPDPFTDIWYIFNTNSAVQKAFRKLQRPSVPPPPPPPFPPKPSGPKPIPKPSGPNPNHLKGSPKSPDRIHANPLHIIDPTYQEKNIDV